MNTLYRDSDQIDLTGATEDYQLDVGEQAVINFSSVTTLPLRVATVEGVYNLKIIGPDATISGAGSDVMLSPNNGSSNISMLDQVLVANNGGAGAAYTELTGVGLPMGTDCIQYSNFDIITFLKNKSVFGAGAQRFSIYNHHIGLYGTLWNDTTTAWTSLGTVRFPAARTGKIIITRTA